MVCSSTIIMCPPIVQVTLASKQWMEGTSQGQANVGLVFYDDMT